MSTRMEVFVKGWYGCKYMMCFLPQGGMDKHLMLVDQFLQSLALLLQDCSESLSERTAMCPLHLTCLSNSRTHTVFT